MMFVKKAIKAIVPDVPLDANADWLHRPEPRGMISKREYQRPHCIKGESAEKREKRLAERAALTLEAFKIAYDNHNPRRRRKG